MLVTKGLDFHNCDIAKRVPQSESRLVGEYWEHSTYVEYYCLQCGVYQHAGPITTVKVPK